MTIARTVDRDESLPHQIVISSGRHEAEVSVSCNCRRYSTSGGYSPIGHAPVGEEGILLARKMYDDPANHNKVEGEPDFHPDLNNYKKIRHVEVTE
jgi:hypothetical protein